MDWGPSLIPSPSRIMDHFQDDEPSFTEQFDIRQCDATPSRAMCGRCRRPATVCICCCLPDEPFKIGSRVVILQHPNEESRSLATVPLLTQCVETSRCHVIRGKRFDVGRNKVLDLALSSADSILLFPGDKALELHALPRRPIGGSDGAAVIVIDGTWSQAKSIFNRSRALGAVKQVQLTGFGGSEYSIRTQPTRGSLSTLESVAHILAWLETDSTIVEVLVRPLRAMCRHQIEHGAVHHHSRDDPDYMSRQEYK